MASEAYGLNSTVEIIYKTYKLKNIIGCFTPRYRK
jgi:hypothetical protein